MSRELLARGASPNITDKDGRSPLHLAAEKGHLQVVQDLLRKRADPTLRDKVRSCHNSSTAAGTHLGLSWRGWWAAGHVRRTHQKSVRLSACLASHPILACSPLTLQDGKTALDLAVAGEHVRVVALLRDATALLGISPGEWGRGHEGWGTNSSSA